MRAERRHPGPDDIAEPRRLLEEIKMDAIGLLRELGALALAGSVAVLLVVLASGPLRRRCGAGAAYALWWCVPLVMLAVLLPARTVRVPVASTPMLPSSEAAPVAALAELSATAQAGIGWAGWLLAAWAVVAAGVLLAGLHVQRRFEASLGTLRRRDDGVYESDAVEGLPAVVGWRPRIVLPADFTSRYSPREQALVLAHERVHLARGDLRINAVAGLLCATQWFNPLAWWALRRFRVAQELACDAAVLAAAPGQRRSYGEALLKTSVISPSVPLACRWPGTHPLKERLKMLEAGLPSRTRRSAGRVAVAGFVLACSAGAWAMQAPREVEAVQAHEVRPERANVEEGVHLAQGRDDHVSASVNWEGDRILAELARATDRTLEIEAGVTGWRAVVLQLESVPATHVAMIVQDSMPGVRVEIDDSAIRVFQAAQ